MSYKNRRDGKSSHYDKGNRSNRQGFNNFGMNRNDRQANFKFNLYENDRQARINEIADDDDGDLIIERQTQLTDLEKPSRIVEANDRRHDAVIFGDKTTEEQQKNQLWDSFKQSSKYASTSLAGPLLLEDAQTKRLRWKNKIRELWIQRYSVKTINTNNNNTEMDTTE